MSYLHPEVDESELLSAVEDTVAALRKRFKAVAYFSDEDVAQELRVLALEALPHYKRHIGPLKSYLYKAARNRWLNRLREFQGRRNEPACAVCHAARLGRGPGHPNGECRAYQTWVKRNMAKAGIACPQDIMLVGEEKASRRQVNSTVVEDVALDEILRLLDDGLDADHRRLWLQAREGVRLPKALRQQVEKAVMEVLLAAGLTLDDLGLPADEQEV